MLNDTKNPFSHDLLFISEGQGSIASKPSLMRNQYISEKRARGVVLKERLLEFPLKERDHLREFNILVCEPRKTSSPVSWGVISDSCSPVLV